MDKRTVFSVVPAAALMAMLFCVGGRVMAQGGPAESPPILYAAGYERNSDGVDAAMVWKIDGATVTPIALTDGTRSAQAHAIAANGGSLYAAGGEFNSDGKVVATVWMLRGRACMGKGDRDRAIAELSRAIELDPALAAAWMLRGRACMGKGDRDRAIAEYTQAIRLDGEYGAAYGGRGWVYHSKGDYPRARADYEQALKFDPGLSYVRDNLEVLRQMGR
ncbi:MAG: tetratricopeptide repeat protein [Treponema sp.]|jgi:tetratricopeptide (TPR) repeat protein|nr:tetratricopeptide repeat protein [Treponema sp.]